MIILTEWIVKEKTDGVFVCKEVLIHSKLQIGKRGKKKVQ
jgi:hypothetical protein